MQIITLTTDLGTRDYYVGAVKGELLKAIPECNIIDLSHHIDKFDIQHAAFVIKNAFHHFPKGAIHLVGVNLFDIQDAATLIIKQEHYYFIGPDNGLFGMVWDGIVPKDVFEAALTIDEISSTLPMKDVYVRLASHIVAGKPLAEIGKQVTNIKMRINSRPTISVDHLKGSVIHLDSFYNAITDIRKEEFDRIVKGRRVTIQFKNYYVEMLSRNYADTVEGSLVAFFNEAGYLEIALNKGKASTLLNFNKGDAVLVDFA